MKKIFRSERRRILSNYARLFAGLLLGIWITRLLLEGGEWLFSIYTLITVGMGVSIVLTELLLLVIVPFLGANVSNEQVVDAPKFRDDLFAAFAISLGAALLGAAVMILLGWLAFGNLETPDRVSAAWLFLVLRIVMMVVTVALTPAMAVLLVSSRQPEFNIFLFLVRLGEFLGIAIPLWLLNGEHYAETDILVQIGAWVAFFTAATYVLAAIYAFRSGPVLLAGKLRPQLAIVKAMLKRTGWSFLQIISSNLYVRADVLIVAAFLGAAEVVALGIAIRLMGYVRQATNGLVTGLDATFANHGGQRKRQNKDNGQSKSDQLKLLSLSTALQGGVVFQLSVLIFLLREEIVTFWVGDILEDAANTGVIEEIGLLASLMIIGIGFRSLNLGWFSAMNGLGRAKHFTPWLLPGAIGNASVLGAWGLFAPETLSVMAVGWVFVGFQVATHGFIMPVVSARSLGCRLQTLVTPLLVPCAIAVATYLVAHGLSMVNEGGSNEFRVAVVVLTVSLGGMANLFLVLRRSNHE
ncbi:hypothetical protein [Tritonibacter mobilis]|uniref:hypothetical protein n=1 Tax=Tritonibacter mobilis TaxID=379347 RepID=UPI001401C99D|nr:hypothetical protein [Tritonibacter mobilis]NHM17555.1 hypothetical protein [Tritonibacter mobilis]NHM21743.1 hypothetical protein [Tritonibacter mobilis]